ncbi:pyridoxamine 5'-phosphate oxidase [Fodinicola acaciae]|uniref:pyridoxamine 5'-phosphate oxidase n=1 Tax=Fodinicola acaciae TaxID=2681555 RepID=UPI0013CFC806
MEIVTDPAEHLAEMRRTYTLAGLTEDELAGNWLDQFRRWYDQAYAAGVIEPNAMVFGTADSAARPSSRTVLCKGVDERGFVLYTNYTSRKGRESADNPHASLLFPWYALERQVIVTGAVERVEDVTSDEYFASRPYGSRIGAWASEQSAVIPSRAVLENARAELTARYPETVPRPPHWGGLRVRPATVEFWQGRPDRLHDRLRFRRDGTEWIVERLSP